MTARTSILRTLLLATFAAGCQTHAASCTHDPSTAAAQHAWQSRHLEDYRFVWQQKCFCLPEATQPIVVTVRHGAIISATYHSGVTVPDEIRANLMTIDALYRHVESTQCGAATVRVTASKTGVPEALYIDPNAMVADDEFNVTISAFTILR